MPKLVLLAGKHSCLGAFNPAPSAMEVAANPPEAPDSLEVPVMFVYCGKFATANTGEVEVRPEHIDRVVDRHNSLISKIKRMTGAEHVPAKHQPPMQVDHSTSGWDTVGRVVGEVSKGVHILEGGVSVPALYGVVRILGKENTQRVLDGRWTNVSVGCDFEEGKMMECSVVPFPAAADAAMLSGEREKTMDEQMKAKLKKHMTTRCKMSEEDAEKKLGGMKDDECTKMSAEADDAEKAELAAAESEKTAEEEKKKEFAAAQAAEAAKLAAAPAKVVQLSADQKSKVKELAKGFRTTGATAQLEGRKASIAVRLSKLQAEAKITPAEVKKVDVAKLAAATQETVDAVLKAYDDREPVVLAGVFGTAKATNVAELAREIKGQKLEAETLANMPSLAKARAAQGEAQNVAAPGRINSLAGEKPAATETVDAEAFAPVMTLLDGGKSAEAKTELKKVVAKLSAGHYAGMTGTPKETEAQLSALAESVKSMQNQFDELMKLVGPVLGFDGSDL